MGITIATDPSRVFPCDWLNKWRGISIPPWLWEDVFRKPTMNLSVLVAAGDKVMLSNREGALRILKVLGPFTTTGPGLWIDNEPRPPYYSLACIPAWRVYPNIDDIEFLDGLIAENGRIVDLYRKSEREVYVTRRGKVGTILDKYRKQAEGVVATRPDQAYGNEFLNQINHIQIPNDPSVWPRLFRMTPEGEPKLSALLKVGDVVRTSYEPKRLYRVVGIFGPYTRGYDGTARPPHYSITIQLEEEGKMSRRKAGIINELVAIGGNLKKLYLSNVDEVCIVKKGAIAEILSRYKTR